MLDSVLSLIGPGTGRPGQTSIPSKQLLLRPCMQLRHVLSRGVGHTKHPGINLRVISEVLLVVSLRYGSFLN